MCPLSYMLTNFNIIVTHTLHTKHVDLFIFLKVNIKPYDALLSLKYCILTRAPVHMGDINGFTNLLPML